MNNITVQGQGHNVITSCLQLRRKLMTIALQDYKKAGLIMQLIKTVNHFASLIFIIIEICSIAGDSCFFCAGGQDNFKLKFG